MLNGSRDPSVANLHECLAVRHTLYLVMDQALMVANLQDFLAGRHTLEIVLVANLKLENVVNRGGPKPKGDAVNLIHPSLHPRKAAFPRKDLLLRLCETGQAARGCGYRGMPDNKEKHVLKVLRVHMKTVLDLRHGFGSRELESLLETAARRVYRKCTTPEKEADDRANDAVAYHVTTLDGWRISYRESEPEKVGEKRLIFRRRLTKKRTGMQAVQTQLVERPCHMTLAEREAKALEYAARKKQKMKTEEKA